MSEHNVPPKSAALADEELRQMAERKEIISKVTLAIEEILIANGISFFEWQNITATFMDRQMRVAEHLSIKEAKERFEKI